MPYSEFWVSFKWWGFVKMVSQRIGALEDFRGRISFSKELGFFFGKIKIIHHMNLILINGFDLNMGFHF